jgi:hypothetical protein
MKTLDTNIVAATLPKIDCITAIVPMNNISIDTLIAVPGDATP